MILIDNACERLGWTLPGMEAVIIGRSNIVGKPAAQLLLARHCTVTIAHSRTLDLPSVARRADILIAAVGQPEMVRGDWVKPGAIVIDVGINRVTSDSATRSSNPRRISLATSPMRRPPRSPARSRPCPAASVG
jgi:methylenetetrahydrofolate dehydrogenase (NADP+)/methenyltetrahydrofolate cyclohydrolase